jgi:hypothetical protein
MSSTTLSIRVPVETKRWLERQARGLGSAGAVVARLIEESRKMESFRGIEFRDTTYGRTAFIRDTRVPVFLFFLTARDESFDTKKLMKHFNWPLWKVESTIAYIRAYTKDIEQEADEFKHIDFNDLKTLLPSVELYEV